MRRMVLLLALAGLSACQDYRFNPVGKCLIQPGQARVSVADISTADILFVVDDSFSMHPIQQSLADNFGSFVQQLAATQAARVATGKQALDFYVAVTTSSVLVNKNVPNANCSGSPLTCSIAFPQGPPARQAYSYTCTEQGGVCGDIVTNYYNYTAPGACLPGVLQANGDPYPAGAFVAAGSNPKVLAFTKGLNWANWASDAAITTLRNQFSENILVGDCGANQEMHLEAGRLAVQKARAGQQGAGATWPHDNSKLVVVWVGNEDDCSTRGADHGGLVWNPGAGSGADSCASEALVPAATSKLFPVADYAAYFGGLGRPLGAAFIRPGNAGCDCAGGTCGGYGPATRFKALAAALRSQGASVYEDSVCSTDFATTLRNIADLLPPPDSLQLPSAPAADVVTQLRVQGADGKTVHVCTGPSTADEWWFVDCNTSPPTPLTSGTSKCILLKPSSACVPGQGQTLQAEYLGRVPAAGCATATDCANALGGDVAAWDCNIAAGATRGTCLCARP